MSKFTIDSNRTPDFPSGQQRLLIKAFKSFYQAIGTFYSINQKLAKKT